MNTILVLILLTFPLGQLTRVQVTPAIHVYVHDLLIAALGVTILKNANRSTLFGMSLAKPILVTGGVFLLSLLANSGKVTTQEFATGSLYLVRWFAYTAVYFAAALLSVRKKQLSLFGRPYHVFEALLVAGVSIAVFGLIQYLLVPDTRDLKYLGWDDHYYRLIGTFLDPAFTGILLTLTFILALGIPQPKLEKSVTVGLSLLALLLTYSRASYLGALAAVTLFIAFLAKKRRDVLFAFTLLVFLLSLALLPRAQSEGTNLLRLYSVWSRTDTWIEALAITREKPILGAGFNLVRYARRDRGFLGSDWEESHSGSGIENSFLFVLAASGIAGLGAFLFLLYRVVSQATSASERTRKATLLASILAVSIHALFTNTWFYPWVIIWMWFLAGAYENPQREEGKRSYSA